MALDESTTQLTEVQQLLGTSKSSMALEAMASSCEDWWGIPWAGND